MMLSSSIPTTRRLWRTLFGARSTWTLTERTERMQRMRRVVKEHNIYRWAASLITELAEIRTEKLAKVHAQSA